LLTNLAPPRSRHVGAVLLRCPQAFFERDVMAIKKAPKRAAATQYPPLADRHNKLIQRSSGCP